MFEFEKSITYHIINVLKYTRHEQNVISNTYQNECFMEMM